MIRDGRISKEDEMELPVTAETAEDLQIYGGLELFLLKRSFDGIGSTSKFDFTAGSELTSL